MQNKEAEKNFFNEFAASQEYDVFDERGCRRVLTSAQLHLSCQKLLSQSEMPRYSHFKTTSLT